MTGIERMGCVYRIQNSVFDILSMEDDLMDDDEHAWELMSSVLRLKSTFLYCDLNKVISHAGDEHKQALVDLSNNLFFYMEELGHAVETRSISLTQDRYNDTARVLREVVAALVPTALMKDCSG